MRVEHNGLTLSFDPVFWVEAGARVELIVQLQPRGEGARVEVEYRRNGEGARRRRARPLQESTNLDGVRFVAELPPFRLGDGVLVTLVGWSDDRRVPGDGEEDSSSFRIEVRETSFSESGASPVATPIEELVPAAERRRARNLGARLALQGISTAADLLGVQEGTVTGLSRASGDLARRLATHAELALAVSDADQRSRLIDAGYASLTDIAATPLTDFRRAVSNVLDERNADRVHQSASMQVAFLDNIATGAAALAPPGACACDDCESVTSPLAYLVDLLSYIRATVLFREQLPGGFVNDVAVDGVDETLYQPISDIVLSCRSVTEPVRAVRLCIETLRRYLRDTVVRDADLSCHPFPVPVDFVVAGDVDRDGNDELVVAFQFNYRSWLALPQGAVGGVWVMDFDPLSRRWSHLGSDCATDMPHPTGASFLLGPGLVARSGFCADIDGDGRAEIVLAVGNQDGSADPQLGKTWLWVMDFDPAKRCWRHISEPTFAQMNADLWLDDTTVDILHVFPANVDGDDRFEIVVAAASTPRPNAFWVFKLVDLPTGPTWMALSPNADASLPAFECAPPSGVFTGFRPRLAFARDVNRDGRDEIVAFPDAPGRLGAEGWVMKYTPSAAGPIGVWDHLNPGSVDLPEPWPQPAGAAHVLGGATRGLNSNALLMAPDGAAGSDPNRFYEIEFNAAGGVWDPALNAPADFWNPAVEIDCAVPPRATRVALCADVDGDFSDELVAIAAPNNQGNPALGPFAWVMKRQPNGQWGHLSPIPGHAAGADLEWGPAGCTGKGALVANVDRTRLDASSGSLVVYGSTGNAIWILKWDATANVWRHLSPVLPPNLDSAYLLAAYQRLLSEMGTSLEELRIARGASSADRATIADRLAVPIRIGPNGPDTIDALPIDPSVVDEATLERLFGLVDTTRNPLSSALVSGDVQGQIRRVDLEGVTWSRSPWIANVGLEGELTLELSRQPGRDVDIRLLTPTGKVVAAGTGGLQGRFRLVEEAGSGLSGWVEVNYVADAPAIRISVIPRVACWRLLRLREIGDEQDWPPSVFDPVRGSGNDLSFPAVEPDVIGTDDFYSPLEKGASADPDGAFDLWVRRREWVDARLQRLANLQPDLDAMLSELRPPGAGPDPASQDHPWASAPAASEFRSLTEALTLGDARVAEAVRARVRSELWLEPDAFLRLVALQARLQDPGSQLTDEEWTEIRSILVLAQKRFNYTEWRNEERASGIVLGPDEFQPSLRSPSQGAWPPSAPPNGVWIDPETLSLADFPQGLAGTAARGLWHARREQLSSISAEIRALRPDLDAMLAFALGPAPPNGWRARARVLADDLNSLDASVSSNARDAVQAEFGLDPGAFRRFAAFDALPNMGRTPTDTQWLDAEILLTTGRKRKQEYPAWGAEEQTLGRLLPYWRARRAVLPRWRASDGQRFAWEEELRWRSRAPIVDPDRFPAAWLRVRTVGEPTTDRYRERRQWLDQAAQALRTLRESPGTLLAQIDAMIGTAFFPGEANRLARDLWARRDARGTAVGAAAAVIEVFGPVAVDLAAVRADLNSPNLTTATQARARAANDFCLDPADFSRLADLVAAAPGGLPPADSVDLDGLLARAALIRRIVGIDEEASRSGLQKRALLEPLLLTPAAHAELLRIRRIAAAGGPVLEPEWNSIIAISLRAMKRRQFGAWLLEEYGAGAESRIRVGPDSFSVPDQPDPDWQPSDWLVEEDEYRRWRDRVKSRSRQDGDVLAAVKDAVSRAEEATLPILRDTLLRAITPADGDAADWVEDHFLIDARASGCGVTTRAEYAIDTLLAFLWSLRTGRLRTAYPPLWMNAPSFDADWSWIGARGSWRSAILARRHSENLLQPTLRRHKTPVFAHLLDELRSARLIAPTDARPITKTYAHYFRDICNLNVGALACTSVGSWARDPATGPRQHDFLFAQSDDSGKVYWCTLETLPEPLPPTVVPTGYEQSFWEPLTALQGAVVGIVGATTYRQRPPIPQVGASTPSWVCLFAVARNLERTSLVFVRYNLLTRAWEDQQELAPVPSGPFSVRLLAHDPQTPPSLSFEETRPDGSAPNIYEATMNGKCNAWNAAGLRSINRWAWQQVSSIQLTRRPLELHIVDGNIRGGAQIASLPATQGRIEFIGLGPGGLEPRGRSEGQVEAGSRVCTGDFDADDQTEIAWTLPILPPDNFVGGNRVFVEKRVGGSWRGQGNFPCSTDTELSTMILAGDLDGRNGAEILVGIQDRFQSRTQGTWGSFWAVDSTPAGLQLNTSYKPDPEQRDPYAAGILRAAFACSPPWLASAGFAVTGDFDGDGRDELVVSVAPNQDSDLSRGNDFWALDCRLADGTLRPLGDAAAGRAGHAVAVAALSHGHMA